MPERIRIELSEEPLTSEEIGYGLADAMLSAQELRLERAERSAHSVRGRLAVLAARTGLRTARWALRPPR